MLMMPFSVVALVASGIVIAHRRARSQVGTGTPAAQSQTDRKGGGESI
jgi:hypothetical protein